MQRYTKKQLLGSGGFAKVYFAIDNVSGSPYAMKVIDIVHVRPEDYANEIKLFEDISRLSHPNIVKYETSSIDPYKRKCYILMEYCSSKFPR